MFYFSLNFHFALLVTIGFILFYFFFTFLTYSHMCQSFPVHFPITFNLLSHFQAINVSALCRISIICPSISKSLPVWAWCWIGHQHSFWTPKGLTNSGRCEHDVQSTAGLTLDSTHWVDNCIWDERGGWDEGVWRLNSMNCVILSQ